MEKLNVFEKLQEFEDRWSPKVIGELNGQHVKLAKLEGEFVWHHHTEEDELFFVLEGELEMHFRDRVEVMHEADMLIVPRGVEHRPIALGEVHVLLFEPISALNTGNVRNEHTVDALETI